MRQRAGQGIDARERFAGTHPLEHQRHRHEAVADEHHPRIDHAAIPLTAEHGGRVVHLFDDIRLAHRRDMAGHAMTGRDRGGHAARRAVHDDRPRPLGEHAFDRQRDRRLLADVAAVGRGDRKPVGVRILKKSDIGVLLPDPRQHAGEVFGRRLRQMFEQPVGLAPLDHHLTPEMLEERHGHAAARAMPAVEPDPRPVAADRRDIHGRRDETHVRGRAVHFPDIPDGLGQRPRFVARGDGLKSFEHLLAGSCREHAARAGEQFHAVVGRGIVAGRDLDAAGRDFVANHDPDGGRGRHAAVDHVAADPCQIVGDRGRQHGAARAAVAADHDRAGGQRVGKRGGIPHRHVGCEARAHDTA